MTSSDQYDAIVIGSGQGGGPLAVALAKAGWKTALVERQHVGGTCVNFGCTPTKTMVASARVAYLARRASDYGVRTGSISVDLARVRQRKQSMVERFRNGSQDRMEKTENLTLLFGEASFVDSRTLEVRPSSGSLRHIGAKVILLNTGARPAVPDLPGIEGVPVLDSTSIMELEQVPEHLLVVGGGYIGLEFAQMFRRFGSRVTLVHKHAQLLTREDVDVAEEVAKILGEDGVETLLDCKIQKVGSSRNGGLQLQVLTTRGERTLEGSHLLAAAGRTPNTDRLQLEAAGVRTDPWGFVQVNERLETNVTGIYALGDVKGGPAFTHISYDDFRILRTNLLAGGTATTRNRLVPYTVFIDPQLGRVGASESDARKEAERTGRQVRVAKMPMSNVARALEMDEPRGFMKVVVDGETQQILGGAILGIEGGEMMAVLQVAMMGHLPYTALRDGVFAHPTLAEAFNNLFTAMETPS